MSDIEKMIIPPDEMKMENKDEFQIVVIKPNNIENFDYNLPNYMEEITNQDFFEEVKVRQDNFQQKIAECLRIKQFNGKQVDTNTFYEEKGYIYELMFLNLTKDQQSNETENQLASLMDINEEKLYGYVMIFKTHIPVDSNKMIFCDLCKKDISRLMNERANTKLVLYEEEQWREEGVKGPIEDFGDKFFDEDKYHIKKIEFAFLRHNINIWYTKSEYGENKVCGKLLNERIDKCLWFSMATDHIRSHLTLDEVRKIIKLSEVLEDYNTKSDMIKEERDSYNRNILKTKHRVLESMYNKHFKNLEL